MDMLREYKDEQDVEREKHGTKWVDHDRLFVKWNGEPMNNNTPYFWLREFCEENNFRFCDIHSLRHFYASALINKGVDAAAVSGALGHSTITTTIPVPNSNTKPTQYLPTIILISKGRFSRSYARNLSLFSEALFSFRLLSLLSFLHCFSVYCTEMYDYAVNGLEIDDNTELVLFENNICVSHIFARRNEKIYRLETKDISHIESFLHDIVHTAVRRDTNFPSLFDNLWKYSLLRSLSV